MLSASESVLAFLRANKNIHNADLIDMYLESGTDMETQVNVSPKGGELVDGTVSTYTDGIDRWSSFRIPRDAFSEPHWKDYPLKWQLHKHVDAIGSTGWNWKTRESRWVAFDVDSTLGHAKNVGIPQAELNRVRDSMRELDYVTTRKSTSGNGLHLYVQLPAGLITKNHNEHAAVGRAVLNFMSQDVGFDLGASVDVCGSNTWFWARRATVENEGFALIKKNSKIISHDLSGWRDHLPVVGRSRSRSRVAVSGVAADEEDIFDQLTASHARIPLDEKHIAIRDALMGMKGTTIWVQDHHLLQTHTVLLKQLMETSALGIIGVFETTSLGSNLNQPNCFLHPERDGSWRVTRFGAGTSEHASWNQDGKGWTHTVYNRRPTLEAAAVSKGGLELAKGGYEFGMLSQAVEMIRHDIAGDENLVISVPEQLATRRAAVKKAPNGQVMIEVPAAKDDPPMPGWNASDKKGHWTQIVKVEANPIGADSTSGDYDQMLRCLETIENQPAGWAINKETGTWMRKAPSAVKTVLQALGNAKPEAECVMGSAELKPWTLVTVPFAPEYPGSRQWNLGAPQLAMQPADPTDSEESQHPSWDMVLDHIGTSLTPRLRQETWARDSCVTTGRQYLQAWYANVLRFPCCPLPYLFFYGPENSGKSIFHEAFSLLVTRGVIKADQALTSQFNAELEGCIVAVVEEKNIATAKGAHEKIKEAVTGKTLSIRRMRTDVYQIKNTTHWVQCSNDISACPIFNGDSRITVCHVPEIEKEIPKERLMSMLLEEAPYFLRTLLTMPLPKPTSRLQLPLVHTDEKTAIQAGNQTIVESFIQECCTEGRNLEVAYSEFFEALQKYPGAAEINRQKLSRELCTRKGVSIRAGAGNKRLILGLTLKQPKEKK